MFSSLSRRKTLVAIVLLGTAAGAVAGANGAAAIEQAREAGSWGGAATRLVSTSDRSVRDGSLADMVERVGPAVVQIEARQEPDSDAGPMMEPDGFGDELGEHFGGMAGGQPHARAALGSGFIIDASGIVVTNNHVVENARRVKVTLSDGRQFEGRVLGSDPKTDLAVIKIENGSMFEAIAWGDSDGVRVGEDVFAVGSPFGLGNTVTAGIVSARGREIGAGPYDDFLQVDAAINSGNSGGPLFNGAGHVVGVNTAIFSPTGGNVGIGFAIPSRQAQSVVQQIVRNGHVSRGRIGVLLQPVTGDVARNLGLPSARGALIAQVEPNGPAERAGLRSGDVVTNFGGRPIGESRDLARAVAEARGGTEVRAGIFRGGRTIQVNLRVDETSQG